MAISCHFGGVSHAQERIEAQDDEEDDEYNSWARWEELSSF